MLLARQGIVSRKVEVYLICRLKRLMSVLASILMRVLKLFSRQLKPTRTVR